MKPEVAMVRAGIILRRRLMRNLTACKTHGPPRELAHLLAREVAFLALWPPIAHSFISTLEEIPWHVHKDGL